MATPRGIRNHNPGNIERTGTPWRGMAHDQSGDERFIVFEKVEYGIRAMARILRVYQKKHGCRTVRDIINRWAPPVENNTQSYINHVAEVCGVDQDQPISLYDDRVVARLIKAIIHHENGDQPYDNATIHRGILMEES